MTERLRAGLIGCGFFARNHLHAWNDLAAEVDLVAVCDRERAKAEAAAAEFGVPEVYDDAGRMFSDARLDFVDVVTTMPSHEALVTLAARHRVPTIVQKPFAPTWDACVRMVEACRAAGVPLMVHENFRFQTPMLAVRRALESGAIGRPYWGRVTFRTNYDVYARQPYLAEEEQLILLDLGIHVLDLARVFLGEVAHLTCETQRINPRVKAEDMATTLLRHESGAVSVVDCTYESKQLPDPFPQTLVHLEGERGSIKLNQDFEMVVTADGAARTEHVGAPLLPWTSKPWHAAQESVLNTQRHWVESLRAGREPETSGLDNLKTYALVMAAYESAAERRPVDPRRYPG